MENLVHLATNKSWYVILGRISFIGNGAHEQFWSSLPLHIGIGSERLKCQRIHTWDGRICIASNKGQGWIIAIFRAIFFENGVQKYVQSKPMVYKICATTLKKLSTKIGMLWMETLHVSFITLLGGRILPMCNGAMYRCLYRGTPKPGDMLCCSNIRY